MKKFTLEDHADSFLPEGKEWKLVWHDEFDGTELDETKWGFRLNFWGQRFKTFTTEGVELDGNSHIRLHMIKKGDDYYSPLLQTGSLTYDMPKEDDGFWPFGEAEKPKFMHRYGYYEVRCRFQKTNGWWSAFWLQTPSPGITYDPEWSGVEVDIMEYFGKHKLTSGNFYGGYGADLKYDARVAYDFKGNICEKGVNPSGEGCEAEENEFHRFGLLWAEDKYVFYYDGKEMARTTYPISKVPQFILLTTEVQGYRRGDGTRHEPRAEDSLNDQFVVDYVRVFDRIL
jgi:beta-glucanase (GH16 family)